MRKMFKWNALLLVAVLVFAMLQPMTSRVALADSSDSLEGPSSLQQGKWVKSTIEKPEGEQWFELTPNQADVQKTTHARITLKTKANVSISVYPSKDRAEKDETFDMYRSNAIEQNGKPVEINMPYGWQGPYYIKVTNLGNPPSEDPEAPKEEAKAEEPASYEMEYHSVNLPPTTPDKGGMPVCPVEMTVGKEKAGQSVLAQLRHIRDGLLSQTKEGKELSSLYYKTAPFLVGKMIVSKDLREDVLQHLLVLKPIFKELAEKGGNSTHVITAQEQKAIDALYKIVLDATPSMWKDQIEKVADSVDLHHLAGKKLSDILVGAKLVNRNEAPSTELIVKLKDNEKAPITTSKLKQNGVSAEVKPAFPSQDAILDDLYVVKVKQPSSIKKQSAASQEAHMGMTKEKIEKLSGVEFVEENKQYHALTTDTQYPYQWSLENKDGKKGADIGFTKMNKLAATMPLQKVKVAVVDTGVDHTLADLKEVVHPELGKNFHKMGTSTIDDNAHGTHVAGIIAASANNGYSMTGINTSAEIIPVKVLDENGSGDLENVAKGIVYAANQGAKVINLSLGGPYSRSLEVAMKYAHDKGALLVVASGNEAKSEVSYPASSKYAFTIGATNSLDVVSDYSNYGKGLDMVAPGTDIPSIVPDGNVTFFSGTSMATPHVVGAASMLLAANPKLTAKEIATILTQTADQLSFHSVDSKLDKKQEMMDELLGAKSSVGYDKKSGWGRLNAYNALSAVRLHASIGKVTPTTLTGTAEKGASIVVKDGKHTLGKTTADNKGRYSVKIAPTLKAKVISVHITTSAASTTLHTVSVKAKVPAAPSVKAASATKLTGKAVAGGSITIMNKGKSKLAKGTVSKKGTFTLTYKKQKKGTKLYVTVTSRDGVPSKATVVTVK
ncbi:cell wall-associated protease [Fictibacillus macauensis ZFHKF-1]|uniref:Cell wall-associated protease n=1 Tax=Fictibacillus macauensis ZFHKF-1 TaxID=1196324 RepID=I8AF00_9BACL|nr:S8 family peptidase [Fictibacillus macauensis]EIT83934.1 cell wall-associated protease [Fictibacillus macauensis ZFHKF-1]